MMNGKRTAFLWPTVSAIAIFLAVSLAGFAPQLEGKVLRQHDTQQFDGMSRDIRQCRRECNRDPQWTGAMFGGMPAYLINIRYDSQIIKRTAEAVTSVVKSPAGMIFFAMVGAWLMMIMFGCSPWLGIIAGIMYGLSTYFFLIIGAGHITKMWALAAAPLFLGSVYMTLRGNMISGGIIAALSATIEIGAFHPQITYYFVLTASVLWITDLVYALRRRQAVDFAKRTGILAAAAILAVGANFAPLHYTAEHSADTMRGGSEVASSGQGKGLDLEYATAWSYGIAETWNTVMPGFMGGSSSTGFSATGPVAESLRPLGLESYAPSLPAYWGEQPYTAGPTYLGIVAVFLALLGFLMTSPRNRWWIGISLAASVILAWGHNAMWATELCFDILPGYNKFRTVSTILVVAELLIPLMATLGLVEIFRNGRSWKDMSGRFLWTSGITAAILLFFAMFGEALFDFNREVDGEMMSRQFLSMFRQSGGEEYIAQGMHDELGWAVADAMAEERGTMLEHDAVRSLLFVIATALTLFLYFMRRIGKYPTLAILTLLVAADMLSVNLRYLPYSSFVQEKTTRIYPTVADKAILEDHEPGFRVLNLTVSPFNDATTSMFHRSVGGYHGAKMGRYQDVITAYLSDMNPTVLDMLNTKYVISSPTEAELRPSAYGAAWMVDDVLPCKSADEELAAIGNTDLRHTAVMAERDSDIAFHQSSEAVISLTGYQPDRLTYEYSADTDVLAVFSEIYYDKGWKAYVDGVESPYFRADYILRAMVLPSGQHTVEWRFRAPGWAAASAVTLGCSLCVIMLVLGLLYFTLRRRKADDGTVADGQ